MTDVELVEKKLARIDSCVRDLRTLAKPETIHSDVLQQRFVEHTSPWNTVAETTSLA